MKKLSNAIIFTLVGLFGTTAPALANANQTYTCDTATKVIRDYKGNPQAWSNRGLYERSRQATLYIQAHCSGANTGSVINANLQGQPQGKVRQANTQDFYNAGYRKGVIAGQLAARRASSVTDPTINHGPTQAPVRTVYVNPLKPKATMVKHTEHKPQVHKGHKHVGHNHHSEAERLDCELTDSLNRQAGPITTVIKREMSHGSFSKVHRMRKAPMMKHGNHHHKTAAEKADCARTDALNRAAGPVVTIVKHTR